MNNSQLIDAELRRRQIQVDSVRGKETPYRVEFRYPQGTKHWQYFVSQEDAADAEDSICGYDYRGSGFIRRPLSRQIQVRGPRGGWRKIK